MHRIANRSWIVLVFALILVAGTLFFVYEYAMNAESWVFHAGSLQIYAGNRPVDGILLDRDGQLLLDMAGTDTYAEEETLRKAVLHWTGDRQGNVATPLVKHYLRELVGYDLLDGAYSYGQVPGEMELTLSAKLQVAALKALGEAKGTVAVYNYKTGEILCAVSTPTFDPDKVPDIAGDTTGAYEGVYLNRFTQATYTPGSIFKIVTTAAALETIPDILEQQFICTGSVAVGGRDVTCERAHGTQNLADALANSCNCAYASIAQQVGGERLQRYAEDFGITGSISFDGIQTVAGKLEADRAEAHDLAWAAIGQHTDLVNPCQFMSFMGAIANDGVTTDPYIVDRITVGNTVTYRAGSEQGQRIMSVTTARKLQELMRNNVEAKYGVEKFPDLLVCGKSGTAEKDGDQASNGLFAGFVQDQNYPLAFFVVVQEGGYGSQSGIPVISQVLTACMEVLGSQ